MRPRRQEQKKEEPLSDWTDKLKSAADLRGVAGSLGLTEGMGRRFFCPACQSDGGKTPDLAVKDSSWQCFKCGAHGDAFDLVRLVEGGEFLEAADWLSRFTGIPRPNGHIQRSSPKRKAPQRPTTPRKPFEKGNTLDVSPKVFTAFLEGCRELPAPVVEYLAGRGISAESTAHLGLRFCGREYADLLQTLANQFGGAVVKESGLRSFWHYYKAEVGFMVLPYFRQGEPVYLKARPPMNKAAAEAKGIIRFLNAGGSVPCLYNVDALADADRVLIAEGETDVLSAVSRGYVAVGVPGWAHFKPEWVPLFEGKEVFLVLDADEAGDRGALDIAKKFTRQGQLSPRRVELPAGQDLSEYLMTEVNKEGMTERGTE